MRSLANDDGDDSESETENEQTQSQIDSQPPPLSLAEIIQYGERLKEAALARENTELFNVMANAIMIIEAEMASKQKRQSAIDDFFKQ